MTINEFIQKYQGEFVERYDSSNLNQCLDLVLEWIDAQGHGDLIPLGVLNAYELWTKTPSKMLEFYEKIPNTTDAIPLPGDIIVWSKAFNGTAGHTGIATGWAGQTKLDVFVQNDPLGMYSVTKRYSYTNIYGWLRLKASGEQPSTPECDFEEVLNKYFNQQVTIDFVINYLDDLKAERDKLNRAITDKDKKIAQLRQEIEVVKNKAKADLAKAGVDCQKKLDDQKSKYFIDLETKDMRIKDLEIQIEEAGCVILEHEKPRDGLHRRIVDLLDAWWGYTK